MLLIFGPLISLGNVVPLHNSAIYKCIILQWILLIQTWEPRSFFMAAMPTPGRHLTLIYSIRFRCSNYKLHKCKGYLTTDIDCQQVIPGSLTPHTHEPDFNYTKGLKVHSDIKKNAAVNRGKPSQIVKDILSEEVGAATGQVTALKQLVRRMKRGGDAQESILHRRYTYSITRGLFVHTHILYLKSQIFLFIHMYLISY